ncbi:transmembrane protease serine 9-like isoform X1 [Hemiscyllium ocellatum]|uniref:transmembrane protease serine 9-like isoform X1 n=1 Tax=Hemiscyllium ocellatum TaxID=170820 RepID=UPI00296737B3|nr:transmembrane protease serine 9-like isoform X1 [Hemiscyllium ocellatum]
MTKEECELQNMQNAYRHLVQSSLLDWHSNHNLHHSVSPLMHNLYCNMSCSNYQVSYNSTYQIHQPYHQEGQGEQLHGSTTIWKFPSKSSTILTWNYITISPPLLDQNPGAPFLKEPWVNLHQMDYSNSGRPGSVFVTLLLQFKRNGSTSLTAETVKNTFQQSLTQVSMSSQSGALNGFSTDLTSIRFTEISQADAKALLTSVSTTEIITSNPSTTDATDSPTTYAVTTPTTEIVTSTTRNDSSTSTCGSRPAFFNRIVGGTNSVNGEWPWQVSLQIRSHICGASIISDRWLISAAHCFRDSGSNPSIWTALIGTIDVRRGTVQTIETIIIHPLYRQTSNDYDIAVLKLSSPLIFEANIQPICLPSSDRVFNAGDSCTITGWGALEFEGSLPRILQKANVDIIDDNTCKNIYSQFTERMLCAGFLSGGVDSCQGDSGGPLACMQPDGKWFLAGIVSFGFQCARPGFPGVYARVTALRDWVQEQTGV